MSSVETIASPEKVRKEVVPELESFAGSIEKPGKPENEDRIKVGRNFALVCDGMGGTEDSNIASEAASNFIYEKLNELADTLESDEMTDVHRKFISQIAQEEMETILKESRDAVNKAIEESGLSDSEFPPNTTATIAMIVKTQEDRNLLVTATAGDSPVLLYKENEGTIKQVNESDVYYLQESYKNDLERKEAWERIQNAKNPDELDGIDQLIWNRANRISNSINSRRDTEPKVSIAVEYLSDEDRVIVASDGIECLRRDEIKRVLEKKPKNDDAVLDILNRVRHRNIRQPDHPRRKPDDVSCAILNINGQEEERVQRQLDELEPSYMQKKLLEKIRDKGTVHGSHNEYASDYLVNTAEEILNGNKKINSITRAGGIREMIENYIKTRDDHIKFAEELAQSAGWTSTSTGTILSPEDIERRALKILRNGAPLQNLTSNNGLREKLISYVRESDE